MHTQAAQAAQAAQAQQHTAQYAALAALTAQQCSNAVAAISSEEDHCYSFVYDFVISSLFNASVMFSSSEISTATQNIAECVGDYYEDGNAVTAIVQQLVYAALMQHVLVRSV